ncbi:MAG: methyltransferase domain-containing protein [Hyphomicrobiaceae bacterium]
MTTDDNGPGKDEAISRLQHSFTRPTPDELRRVYDGWANEYEKNLVDDLGYHAPELVAEAATRFFTGIDAPLLDIGCGTGLTGLAVRRHGDWPLHGLDISPEMLEIAREKGIYEKLLLANLNEELEIPDNTYAGAISSGTFTVGHVQAEALAEISRVLAPGAPFAFTVHSDIWDASGFPDTIERLEAENRIELVEKEEKHHLTQLPDKTSFICVALAK